MSYESPLSRVELLAGADGLSKLTNTKIIVFGTGGVGSWCAESLARSGIGQMTIVDNDVVMPSNMNRQLMAGTDTLGEPKVNVLAERLLKVAPHCHVCPRQETYSVETALTFDLQSYDYVVDAIDSLENKADLIYRVGQMEQTKIFSSMGAALKIDPCQVRVADFWQVKTCPLARALRKHLRANGMIVPEGRVACVYSTESGHNKREATDSRGKRINGTLAHITAIFGFTLAGLIVEDVLRGVKPD